MGKSKKKFIDKKNSSTYHVLYRSQRDVGGDGGDDGTTSETVLWPSPHNKKETNDAVFRTQKGGDPTLSKWKAKAAELGALEDDGYDYEQHMKPITGSGDFFDATGHRSNALQDARAMERIDQDEAAQQQQQQQNNGDIQEVSRQLESIALTPECMDEDVAAALFGDFDEQDYEEILDDFCITAAQEPEPEEGDESNNNHDDFDFEAHVAALMERARKQDAKEHIGGVDINQHEVGKGDAAFFAKAKALNQVNEDHDDEEDDEFDEDGHFDEDEYGDVFGETPAGVVPKLGADEEKALCDKFEQTLLEYDSDDVGDLNEECEEICGDRPLEGDTQLEAALDEFLIEKKDEVFMEGTAHLPERRRKGGSGYSALVGTNMVPASQLYEHMSDIPEDKETLEETLDTANEILANPEMEPPAEEVFIDGKSYFSERTRNPWDCESILSTYSNLDNNPTTIGRRRKGKKKKKKVSPDEEEEESVTQIQLSNKTGLPLGVLPTKNTGTQEDYDDTYISVNKGEARKKNETAEEKKARKLAVKEEREVARLQKKMMKEAFKDEFIKRSGDVITNDVAGKSVFRYA